MNDMDNSLMTKEQRHAFRKARLLALMTEHYEGSQVALAEASGVAATLISRYLSGVKGMGEDICQKIEKNTGKIGWFSTDHLMDPEHRAKNQEYVRSKIIQGSGSATFSMVGSATAVVLSPIPVVGTAQLGDNGYWTEIDYPVGVGDGYVRHATNDANAYALRCRGDSMKPRIKDGEYVVVEPNSTPYPGDEVLVRAKDGRVMVKEWLYTRDGTVHLLSVNEAHGKITLRQDEVEVMHKIGGYLPKTARIPD